MLWKILALLTGLLLATPYWILAASVTNRNGPTAPLQATMPGARGSAWTSRGAPTPFNSPTWRGGFRPSHLSPWTFRSVNRFRLPAIIFHNQFARFFYNPFLPFSAHSPSWYGYGYGYAPPPYYYPWAPAYPLNSGYGSGAWPLGRLYYTPPTSANQQDPGQRAPVENAGDDPYQFARQGEAAFKARDYAAAIRAWQHALIDDPDNGELILRLAQALFATGRYDEAAGATQQAFTLLPQEKWGAAFNSNLNLYGNSQDYRDQLKELEEAVRKNPNDPALRFELGLHYGYSSSPADALPELDKLLELAPQDQLGRRLRDLLAEKPN